MLKLRINPMVVKDLKNIRAFKESQFSNDF